MALTVVVRSGDNESAPKITFDTPRVVIGRGEGCEVRLPDPSVSHRHASVRQRGTDYIIVDEGSTNGTFVGPVRLSPQASRVLKSGDQVRVGRVWLEVRMEQAPATEKPQLATKELALELVQSALRAQGQDAQLVVTIVEGPDAGQTLELRSFKRRYVIGRGTGVDLQVTDADASRRHVELERQGDRVRIKDLGSKNGSLLDGEPLMKGQALVWKAGQVLCAGANRFSYQDPVSSALSELEAAEDETLDPLEDTSPPDQQSSEQAPASPSPPTEDVQRATSVPQKAGASIVGTDLLVAAFALVVLTLSALGLYWLFRGP